MLLVCYTGIRRIHIFDVKFRNSHATRTVQWQRKVVCITTNQPDTKSHPNPKPNPTTKQHSILSVERNVCRMSYVSREIHTRQRCCTFLQLSVVIAPQPNAPFSYFPLNTDVVAISLTVRPRERRVANSFLLSAAWDSGAQSVDRNRGGGWGSRTGTC